MALDLSLRRKDEAYLDFVVGLKAFSGRVMNGPVQTAYRERAGQWAAEHAGQEPQTIEEVASLVAELPVCQVGRFVSRKSQEMMWSGIVETYRERGPALEAALNQAPAAPLGKLELDPTLPLPEYYTRHDFHIQPGSYHSSDMSAIVYNMAQQVYHLRTNDKAENQRAVVRAFPPPPTSDPAQVRILDMGCGFGTTTWPFCDIFPQAEIWGIDLAAPLLKLAHQRAQDYGVVVNFSQQNAEKTKFEDGSFDLILAHALLHELDKSALRNVVQEAYRLLKPGGTFINSDVTPYRELTAFGRFMTDWQVENNGEPFWRSTLHETYLPAIFEEIGFQSVREYGLGTSKIAPKFPWLTVGMRRRNEEKE